MEVRGPHTVLDPPKVEEVEVWGQHEGIRSMREKGGSLPTPRGRDRTEGQIAMEGCKSPRGPGSKLLPGGEILRSPGIGSLRENAGRMATCVAPA